LIILDEDETRNHLQLSRQRRLGDVLRGLHDEGAAQVERVDDRSVFVKHAGCVQEVLPVLGLLLEGSARGNPAEDRHPRPVAQQIARFQQLQE